MPSARSNLELRPSASTYFAPAERAGVKAVRQAVERLSTNAVVSQVLRLLGGWVAVLNAQRQVLAVNHTLLHALGADDPASLCGLRPGEMLHCVHAQDHPGGCGTSRFCSTCGAAIAIVASQRSSEIQERECVLTIERNGETVDRDFVVRACPFEMDGEQLVLVCMQDVSEEKRRMWLERTFLHDLGNTLLPLLHACQVLGAVFRGAAPAAFLQIRETAELLVAELKIQRLLCQPDTDPGLLDLEETRPSRLLERLRETLAHHPAGAGQSITIRPPDADRPLQTDPALLLRVLSNMAVNALEAGTAGDEIRVWTEEKDEAVTFRAWNSQPIPPPLQQRVFQQFFSSKEGSGRGLGTHSMKLIGENLLRGRVTFSSTPAEGTTFSITLPRAIEPQDAPARTGRPTSSNPSGKK